MTKAQQASYDERASRILPNSVPRWVRCYDSREPGERYTVVFTGRANRRTPGWFQYVGMIRDPYHPQGIGQHGETEFAPCDTPNGAWPPALGRKCHLGRRIKFEDLPKDCQEIALADYVYLWDLSQHPLYRED